MIYLLVCGAILPLFKRTNKILKIFAQKSNIFLKMDEKKCSFSTGNAIILENDTIKI